MMRPGAFGGMRHVALFVEAFEACERFYVEVLGMQVEWRPDADNLYLTSGCDNLALHRAPAAHLSEESKSSSDKPSKAVRQKLDHIGFVLNEMSAVDDWYQFLKQQGVTLLTEPRTHRDGARSFYCQDPDRTMVQIIWHPPISGLQFVQSATTE